MAKLVLSVRMAWWLNPYIRLLAFFSALTGRQPDMQKLQRVMARGTTIRAANKC